MKPFWSQIEPGLTMYSELKQSEDCGNRQSSESDITGHLPNVSRAKTLSKRLVASVVLNLSLVTLVIVVSVKAWQGPKSTSLVPSPIPDFPREIKSFNIDPEYMAPPSNDSDAVWEALHGPLGREWVYIQEPQKYGYPGNMGGFSVFHQLHCLAALRHFMWDLMYQKVDTEKLLREWPDDVLHPTYEQATKGLWHIAHCFDYVRQGVQCMGDTSLEFVPPGRHVNNLIDGLDYPHDCVNWDALREYSMRNGD